MKIPLVGGSSAEDSLPWNASRSINFYPVKDQEGKEVAALYGTPGLSAFGTGLGTGPWREVFRSRAVSREFGISGSQFFEINSDGTGTSRGTINQSAGIVYMAENPTQLAICDGTNLYLFTYATNRFEQIIGGLNYCANGDFSASTGWTQGTGWAISGGIAAATTASSDLYRTSSYTLVSGRAYSVTYTIASLSAGTVTVKIGGTAGTTRSANGTYTETIKTTASDQLIKFTGAGFTGNIDNVTVNGPEFGFPNNVADVSYLDGYFVCTKNSTKSFYISAVNDGSSWNALNFASKASTPANLLRSIPAVGQLWLLAAESGEVWTDTGASTFPFQRIAGAKLTVGIYAPASALEIDNSLMWLGSSKEGIGIVYRANGFTPQRISTTAMEVLIAEATDPTNIKAYSYQQEGHLFYVLTGGGLPTTLVYDVTIGEWHERAYMNSQGAFETHLAYCCMSAFGKIIVGDKSSNQLYSLDLSTYSDNGAALVSERIYTHLSQEDKRIRFNRLSIFLESGVGLQSGQGSDPKIELAISVDGGRTWSDWQQASMGKVGQYQAKAAFYRLGVGETLTLKVRISDPVKRRLIGSYLS